MKRFLLLLTLIGLVLGCATPLRTSVAPFRPPETFANSRKVWELVIAANPLDTPDKSIRIFGTDLATADILPVQLIVLNKGTAEYEVDASQIFGSFNGEFYPAFNLTQAAQRVRESSIGTTVAGQAAVSALLLAAAGAAAGAGIGSAAGNAGAGAAAGAAVGGSAGALAGAAAGASDSYTHRFRHELAVQDFGARNIYAGDMYQGFIYFQRQPYTGMRVKVTNLSERKTEIVEITLSITPTP